MSLTTVTGSSTPSTVFIGNVFLFMVNPFYNDGSKSGLVGRGMYSSLTGAREVHTRFTHVQEVNHAYIHTYPHDLILPNVTLGESDEMVLPHFGGGGGAASLKTPLNPESLGSLTKGIPGRCVHGLGYNIIFISFYSFMFSLDS